MYSFAFTGLKPAACRAQELAIPCACNVARTRVYTRRLDQAYLHRRDTETRVRSTFPPLFYFRPCSTFGKRERESVREHPCLSPPLPSGWKNNYPVSWTVSARGPRQPCLQLVPATPPSPCFQPLPTLFFIQGKRDEFKTTIAKFLADCFDVWWEKHSRNGTEGREDTLNSLISRSCDWRK